MGLLARLSVFAIPVLGLVLIYAGGIEVFRLADNHAFRREVRPVERKAIDEAFQAWLASRKDCAAYDTAQRPYPVYVVAAEGGGLYAGNLAAQFLTRMQDLCPNFAQHLFAVSSVSGGSLGAAVFAGLSRRGGGHADVKRIVSCPGRLEMRAKEILSSDFLAPVVWGGLFPDFLQRFMPSVAGSIARECWNMRSKGPGSAMAPIPWRAGCSICAAPAWQAARLARRRSWCSM